MRIRIKLTLFAIFFVCFSLHFSQANILDSLKLGKLRSKGQLSLSVNPVSTPKLDSLKLDKLSISMDTQEKEVEEEAENKEESEEAEKTEPQEGKDKGKEAPEPSKDPKPEKVTVDVPEKEVKKEEKSKFEKDKESPTTKAGRAEETKKGVKVAAQKERVVFNFEGADLKNVAQYVERLFDISFITDDAIDPILNPKGRVSGHKISFKTQKPITKKQAWGLFNTFLNMAGLTTIPQADPKIFIIQTLKKALRSPVPVYINIDPEKLPDNDAMIRYGYFVKDCPLATIKNVIDSLRSSNSTLIEITDNNAFIITDSAYNIKVLMTIVKELDRVSMPQTMSILKLHKVDAKYVKEIFDKIVKKDQDTGVAARLFGPKKKPTALYFPTDAKIIVEKRTNSLILLGTAEGIKKIEEFVTKEVDVDISAPYSPLHVYDLKYAEAQGITNIMNNLVKFGHAEGKPGRGAVRGGEQYFKNMQFTAQDDGNRIIIRGDYDDYLKAKEIIDKLDEPPVQVAIEVLILALDTQDTKNLGAQLRNKFKEPCGSRVNFQTSGLAGSGPIIPNTTTDTPGATRLLGNLINLVTGLSIGSTVVSFGTDAYGVWGVFQMLNELISTQVVSNPFLLATNNTKAKVRLGESRRAITATIASTGGAIDAFDDNKANLEVKVTPQINSDGMIVMDLEVDLDNFIGASATIKNTRKVKTSVVAADKEVLALGGLIRETIRNNVTGVPILSKIPILGWLFKNKTKDKVQQDLVILISAQIVGAEEGIKKFTKRHVSEYRDTLKMANAAKTPMDPIDNAFFGYKESKQQLSKLVFKRGKKQGVVKARGKKKKRSRNKRRKKRRRSRKKDKKVAELAVEKNAAAPAA